MPIFLRRLNIFSILSYPAEDTFEDAFFEKLSRADLLRFHLYAERSYRPKQTPDEQCFITNRWESKDTSIRLVSSIVETHVLLRVRSDLRSPEHGSVPKLNPSWPLSRVGRGTVSLGWGIRPTG